MGSERGNPNPVVGTGAHLGFLDGIRGLAALWVVVGHSMIYGGWYWVKFPEPLIAVDVFMFVSGYLMVHQWTRRVGSGPDWKWDDAVEFWVRRFFRIAPVYYLSLLVMFLAWEPLKEGMTAWQAVNPDRWAQETAYDPARWDGGWLNGILRVSFVFGLLPAYAVTSFMGDWSLSLEMQFYLLFPSVLGWLRKWGSGRMAWGAVVVALAVKEVALRLHGWPAGMAWIYPLPSMLLLKLPVFLVGMILAEVNRERAAGGDVWKSSVSLCLALFVASLSSWYVVGVAALSFFLMTDSERLGRNGWIWQGRVGRVLSHPLMSRLADASYAVYLGHSLVLASLGGWLPSQPWFAGLAGRSKVLVLLALVLAVTYPLAWILHATVEKPGIELGRRLARRIRPSG